MWKTEEPTKQGWYLIILPVKPDEAIPGYWDLEDNIWIIFNNKKLNHAKILKWLDYEVYPKI